MHIGPHQLAYRVILAPVASVTDHPFPMLCRRYSAAFALSEKVSANLALGDDRKTLRQSDHAGEPEPRAVQILGSDPEAMAEAARVNADRGAPIIDINMGYPAKKVCQKAAGPVFLKGERLADRFWKQSSRR